jgi:hypothetical protein
MWRAGIATTLSGFGSGEGTSTLAGRKTMSARVLAVAAMLLAVLTTPTTAGPEKVAFYLSG